MNYLRNFTKGEVQNVVDNFWKRHHTDLAVVLRELWRELERRFGNTAAITNALLERLIQAANFSEKVLPARRTTVMGDNDSYARTDTLAEMPPGVTDSNEYDIVPCPNKFLVTDSLADRYTNDLKNDVFHSLPSDNEISLSCEDRKFLKVMEAGIHKNKTLYKRLLGLLMVKYKLKCC
ncbi:hypothetical protein QZH41_007628 [Actinostola sp. cb2023]|nr:hypothetical protein QZH41_007628 [Actinostola sp. cb2023]